MASLQEKIVEPGLAAEKIAHAIQCITLADAAQIDLQTCHVMAYGPARGIKGNVPHAGATSGRNQLGSGSGMRALRWKKPQHLIKAPSVMSNAPCVSRQSHWHWERSSNRFSATATG